MHTRKGSSHTQTRTNCLWTEKQLKESQYGHLWRTLNSHTSKGAVSILTRRSVQCTPAGTAQKDGDTISSHGSFQGKLCIVVGKSRRVQKDWAFSIFELMTHAWVIPHYQGPERVSSNSSWGLAGLSPQGQASRKFSPWKHSPSSESHPPALMICRAPSAFCHCWGDS